MEVDDKTLLDSEDKIYIPMELLIGEPFCAISAVRNFHTMAFIPYLKPEHKALISELRGETKHSPCCYHETYLIKPYLNKSSDTD